MAGKKLPKRTTQSEDIDTIIRYLKDKNTKNSYQKYISPMVKQKGRQYVDKLMGSTIIVLSERGLNLDDICFDIDGNLTIKKNVDLSK